MTDELAEIVAEHDELLPDGREEVSPTLFGTTDPADFIAAATATADALAGVVRKQGLTATISGREHVKVEGWTLLGSMLGVFPVCVWTRKLEDGWEARVEARTRAGEIVGAAEAECLRSESLWSKRDDYALRSMAQTRATSKALRLPLGSVMHLAGFDATPAEEMPSQPRTPAGAGDPAAVAPADMRIHFGKNGPKDGEPGKRLGDLTERQLAWYADEWEAGESEQDYALKAAAFALRHGTPDNLDGIPF